MTRWRITLIAPGEPPFGIKEQYVEVIDIDVVAALKRAIEVSDMDGNELRGVEMIVAL